MDDFLSVLDDQEAPIGKLTVSDCILSEGGQTTQTNAVSNAGGVPMSMFLLLDKSRSMQGISKYGNRTIDKFNTAIEDCGMKEL